MAKENLLVDLDGHIRGGGIMNKLTFEKVKFTDLHLHSEFS
jgi:hypothetical protein